MGGAPLTVGGAPATALEAGGYLIASLLSSGCLYSLTSVVMPFKLRAAERTEERVGVCDVCHGSVLARMAMEGRGGGRGQGGGRRGGGGGWRVEPGRARQAGPELTRKSRCRGIRRLHAASPLAHATGVSAHASSR